MRELNRLTTLAVSKTDKPGRYSDGGGLYLQVSKWGTKAWLFRYMLDRRPREMGLGSLSAFSLKEARERARKCRQMLTDGMDPIETRLAERDAKRAEEAGRITFKAAATKYIATHETGWRNAKHRQQWKNTLTQYAYPTLGARPVSAIEAAQINETVAPIWRKKPETARRVKQRIGTVVQWVRDGMPLPTPGASKRVKHHKALPWQEIPAFMEELRGLTSISARALEFTILTAVRTSETIGATWREIDMDAKVWMIPGKRMKANRPHRVPLSDAAIRVLKDVPREHGNPYVFMGAKEGRGLSNMAMLEVARGLRDGLTVHGFRSAFKDWASEATNTPNIVSEMALAHTVSDKVEAAYRRGDLFTKRTKLMRDWAKYCATPASEVVSMKGAA
jgi:integrase